MNRGPRRRVRRGLAQYARQRGIDPARVAEVFQLLERFLPLCGDVSQSRKSAYHIGCVLLEPASKLFAPVCPDYSHEDGKYTFRQMGDGIPLLFLKHRVFLEFIRPLLQRVEIVILLADHERELQHLRGILGVTGEAFERNIQGSLKALQKSVPPTWKVGAFTEIFPGFTERIWEKTHELLADERSRHALLMDTIRRQGLYSKIGYPVDPPDTRLTCTAHVAAQYVCLGKEAEQARALICNHTTTSLRWYTTTQAAVLHNPVTIY